MMWRALARLMRWALDDEHELPCEPQPWSMPADVMREGFDVLRNAVPVDDDEIASARRVSVSHACDARLR
jgi:hypothetical protein